MTLESKENYPRHTKIVQNSLGFMPEVKPLHKPRGDLVLCARKLKLVKADRMPVSTARYFRCHIPGYLTTCQIPGYFSIPR